jgi:hypothetical protein
MASYVFRVVYSAFNLFESESTFNISSAPVTPSVASNLKAEKESSKTL